MIDIEDTILLAGIPVPTILANLGRFGSLVTRGPADAACPGCPGQITNIQQTAINQGDTSVSGIDFNASWRSPKTSYGLFNVSLNATYFPSTTSRSLTARSLKRRGRWIRPLAARAARSEVEDVSDAELAIRPVGSDACESLPIGLSSTDGNAAAVVPGDPLYTPHMVPSYTTWDLQTSWSGYQGLTAILGIRNLFDKKPPYDNASSSMAVPERLHVVCGRA